MRIARLRALTPMKSKHSYAPGPSRNENRPIKGIDTAVASTKSPSGYRVEMSIARLRALTCTMNNSECMIVCYSEFFKVFQSSLVSDFL